jgi:hypothetical protein
VNNATRKVPDKLLRIYKKAVQRKGRRAHADRAVIIAPLVERFIEEFQSNSPEEVLDTGGKIISEIYKNNPTFGATIPVYLWESGAKIPELVGSGVLVRIRDHVFLLTAGHVTEQKSKGAYFTLGKSGFAELFGKFIRLAHVSGRVANDSLDVAYLELHKDCVSALDQKFQAIESQDMFAHASSPLHHDYTFAGFPWRKNRVKGKTIQTEFITYSGPEIAKKEYVALGLKRDRHIAIRLNCRKTFSVVKNRLRTSPHPEGMSGGGVYLWNEEAMKDWPVRLPLAGIANRFVSDKSVLIATRLNIYIGSIFPQ